MSPAGAALLLFGSGAAALVYQTLWVKQLALVVGVDVYAVTTAVSAFFAGLALGGAALGRISDRAQRPLRVYAGLEIGVAVCGLLATTALERLALPYVRMQDAVGALAWAMPFVVIGVPAFFMGGTLPALVRAVAPDPGQVAGASGRLYAANTAGGIAGAIATPFLLVPALGIHGTGTAAAGVNLALAVVAAVWPHHASGSPPTAASRPAGSSLALGLYALAGGIALGYEVVCMECLYGWYMEVAK